MTMSTRPKLDIAVLMIDAAVSCRETSEVSGSADPPAERISSATISATLAASASVPKSAASAPRRA